MLMNTTKITQYFRKILYVHICDTEVTRIITSKHMKVLYIFLTMTLRMENILRFAGSSTNQKNYMKRIEMLVVRYFVKFSIKWSDAPLKLKLSYKEHYLIHMFHLICLWFYILMATISHLWSYKNLFNPKFNKNCRICSSQIILVLIIDHYCE